MDKKQIESLEAAQEVLEKFTCGADRGSVDCGCEGSNNACVAWQAIEDLLEGSR